MNNYKNELMLDNCYFVKTVLMILVVFYHSILFWGGGSWLDNQPVIFKSKTLSILSVWLNTFHIYGFTLVSGYIFQYLKYEKDKYQKFLLFIVNKAKRLLVPYVFVAIIWVIPISGVLFSYTSKDIILKYVFCTGPSQLWFLWMLFDVFCFVWIISNWLKNDIIAILISCISWLIGYVCGARLPNIFCIWTAFNYLPFFILGMKLREKSTCFLYKLPSILFLFMQLLLFVVYQMTLANSAILCRLINLIALYSAHVFGALMSFFILQWLAEKIDWKNNRLFMFLSKYSMTIYLFHQQIIYFTIIWLNGKLNPYLHAFVNFFIALTLSSIISVLLMKFKTTRILIGEKR